MIILSQNREEQKYLTPPFVEREKERERTVEEEEESSRPFVECEVPRVLLLYRDQFIPPLKIGFERFEENIWKI